MNIDKPLCNLKTCRYCHDHNCFSADYERCEYTLSKNARIHGEWNDHSDEGYVECPFCDHATNCDDNIEELHYCFFCGASLGKKEGDKNERV